MQHRTFSRLLRTRIVPLMILSLPGATLAQEATPGSAIPRLEPGSDKAEPLTVYEWTAETGATDLKPGLRYTWRLPNEYDPIESYDLVVICHGTGLDYRWGHANYKPDAFRTGDIVVSVDGTSEAEDGSRVFLGERGDAVKFRDFILEVGRALPLDRIFLYGHSQGGFFVVYVASQFPGLTEGVVAHASGVWTETDIEGGIQTIPVAFLHGTADPVIPYAQSIGARDAMRDAGHTMLMVRRMNGYNHWPNALRVSECIDWCSGMGTRQADTALAAAGAMLTPKEKDEYNFECPAPFGGAYQVLRRVALDEENAVEEADDDQKARAKALMERIDAEGARHVEILRRELESADDLILGLGENEGAWLGHLLPLREDFRGVPSVEAFVSEIGLDDAALDQEEAADKLLEIWFANRPEKYKFEVVGNTLGEAFLVDSIPGDLARGMAALKEKAEELGLTEESLEKYGVVETWAAAWKNGYDRYLDLCRKWTFPE